MEERHSVSSDFNYQRLYDRMAPFYGPAMRFFPMWRDYTQQVLLWLPRTGDILEIGPGPGWLLAQLAERYPLAVGFDLSWGMLREAKSRLDDAGLPGALVEGNAVHLPFATDSFDGIAMTFTFSAIPDGLGAMREMARVLRVGGVLSLVDAGVPSNRNPIGVALARTWELFEDYMRDEAALMREAGLEIVERREFGAFDSIRFVVGRKRRIVGTSESQVVA